MVLGVAVLEETDSSSSRKEEIKEKKKREEYHTDPEESVTRVSSVGADGTFL